MSGCAACAAAVANPLSGLMQAGCAACLVREIGRSQKALDLACSDECAVAMTAMQFTPAYKAKLIEVFGAHWTKGHMMVKDIYMRRARKAMEARS